MQLIKNKYQSFKDKASVATLPLRAKISRSRKQRVHFLVLITVYENKRYMETLKSLIKQNYQHITYVFASDASEHPSYSDIKSILSSNVDWHYIENIENAGVGQTLNNALSYSLDNIQHWTHFTRIDLDDSVIGNYFKLLRDAVVVYDTHLAHGTLWQRFEGPQRRSDWMPGIAVYHRNLLQYLGGYDTNRFGIDSEFALRFQEMGGTFAVIPKVAYCASFSDTGLTASYMEQSELRLAYFEKVANEIKNNHIIRRPLQETAFQIKRN
jgi:glycosyltransferase involved in cell wall biosynthesis